MFRCRLLLPALSLLALAVVADAGRDLRVLTPLGSPQAKDLHGDPLPAGAVARLGQDGWLHGITADFAAFLPDGKTVVTVNSDKTIRVWEFPSGKEIRRIKLLEEDQTNGSGRVHAALAKDGKTIATDIGRGEICFHDVATGNKLAEQIKLPELKDMPTGKGPRTSELDGLAFSPNGKQLAAITTTGDVIIWDWAKAKQLHRFAAGGVGSDDTVDCHVLYAPDGKSIATGYMRTDAIAFGNVVVQLWDPATGAKIHDVPVEADKEAHFFRLAFSPDSKTLAFTRGPTITLVEAATGKQIGKLSTVNAIDKSGSKGFVNLLPLAFGKDGAMLYASGNSTVREWDVATRKLVREGPRAAGDNFSLSPDGNTLVLTGQGPQFYDIGGKDITAVNQLTLPLQSLQFLPDGKTLLTRSPPSAPSGPNFGVAFGAPPLQKWDAGTGKNLGPVSSAYDTVSPDGKIAVVLRYVVEEGKKGIKSKNTNPSKFIIADSASGQKIGEIMLQDGRLNAEICFSPDSKTLAIAQPLKQKIELYDVATAKLVRALDAKLDAVNVGKGGKVAKASLSKQSMLFAVDGKTLAWSESRNPRTVSLFDTTTGKQIGSLALPQAPTVLERASFSPDGRCLALNMVDGTAVLYELATGQQRSTFGKKQPKEKKQPKDMPKNDLSELLALIKPRIKAQTCFAFSPDGRSFSQAGSDGIVHVFDIVTGRELHAFKGHTDAVNAVAFAPDGKTLASASDDSTVLIWDVSRIAQPALSAKALKAGDFEKFWEVLAESDAVKAWAAMGNLAAAPMQTVTFIKERLKPAAPLDMKRLGDLIVELDDNQPKLRAKASNELLKMGDQIVPALDKALAANPPLESKLRMEDLRGMLTGMVLQGDRLRAYRAIEVLELIGTPESRQVLQTLAEGTPGALITISAQAALKRL